MPAAMVKTSLKLERGLWMRAKIRAMQDGVDFQTVVSRALRQALLAKALRASSGRRLVDVDCPHGKGDNACAIPCQPPWWKTGTSRRVAIR